MPPIPPDSAGAILDAAARILGWRTGAIPFAINSQQRDGRPECIRCPQCMGHSCPVNAKNGTHNTFIPRALANGNCTLVYAAQALQIRDSTAVSPASVTFATHDCEGTRCLEVSAGRVIVSAGAIETPRLLLASALGNSHVGRHLHAHTIHLGIGELNQELTDFSGPGHSIACLDFAHAGSAPYGGGVIFDAPSQLPLALAEIAPQLGVPAWGPAHKAWMRSGRRRLIGTMTIGQELPHLESSVRVDAKVKDRSGMPVARVHVVPHMANAEVRSFLALRCAEWLAATGAQPGPTLLSGTAMSEHCAGSCRMGHDPTASACGSDGLLHGARHVYVCDASLHPSNGSVNPALTVMANAHRIASALVTQS
jgi:choline dehydrogenase-like flavoprotein